MIKHSKENCCVTSKALKSNEYPSSFIRHSSTYMYTPPPTPSPAADEESLTLDCHMVITLCAYTMNP